jgi:Protein kinase domain
VGEAKLAAAPKDPTGSGGKYASGTCQARELTDIASIPSRFPTDTPADEPLLGSSSIASLREPLQEVATAGNKVKEQKDSSVLTSRSTAGLELRTSLGSLSLSTPRETTVANEIRDSTDAMKASTTETPVVSPSMLPLTTDNTTEDRQLHEPSNVAATVPTVVANEFAWTFAGDFDITHAKKISRGAFGEVHMVCVIVAGRSNMIDATQCHRRGIIEAIYKLTG